MMMAAEGSVIPSDPPSCVDRLLEACPFLEDHRDEYWDCGPTIVFGHVARLLKQGKLEPDQALSVFAFFDLLAETGSENDLEVLATGALELLNDDAASQRLARTHLSGKAREILEAMRMYWGQPDYGGEG